MKLAILDKDGTLTQSKSGAQFVQHPEDQELMPGVKEAIARLVAGGYVLAIASNQGGVAAGHKSLEDAIAEMRYCLQLLPEIDYALFCPDFSGQELWMVDRSIGNDASCRDRGTSTAIYGRYRKPEPGMLNFASEFYSEAVMIGDRTEDRLAAEAAGIPFLHADEWRRG